jgi:hypothetical protein
MVEGILRGQTGGTLADDGSELSFHIDDADALRCLDRIPRVREGVHRLVPGLDGQRMVVAGVIVGDSQVTAGRTAARSAAPSTGVDSPVKLRTSANGSSMWSQLPFRDAACAGPLRVFAWPNCFLAAKRHPRDGVTRNGSRRLEYGSPSICGQPLHRRQVRPPIWPGVLRPTHPRPSRPPGRIA